MWLARQMIEAQRGTARKGLTGTLGLSLRLPGALNTPRPITPGRHWWQHRRAWCVWERRCRPPGCLRPGNSGFFPAEAQRSFCAMMGRCPSMGGYSRQRRADGWITFCRMEILP